jgi:hypothetical protein
MPIAKLPDGAMVQADADNFLIAQGEPLLWSPAGYCKVQRALGEAMLLTPPSTLRALAAGYRAVLHPSARPEPPQSDHRSGRPFSSTLMRETRERPLADDLLTTPELAVL